MMHSSLTPLAAIEFASPWMLGWLAAAALPWLINLWSRRRHVETSWAAVELLMAAVRERSRRLRLRELLLLALRTSILLLVALAAARPAWRHAASAAMQSERTHRVIVIDQSFSMATERDGTSRFQRAKAAARRMVNDAPAGDAFSLIAWSDAADDILGRPTFDPAAVLAAIEALEVADTVARLDVARRAIDAAVKQAKSEFPGLTRTQVTFISDLALNTWAPAVRRGDAADEQRDALPPGARIESVDDGVRNNFAITRVYTEPPLPVLEQPLAVVVDVKSFGGQKASDVGIEMLLDGVRAGQQSASISAGGAAVRFDARLIEPGNHVIEMRLPEGADSLAVDNRRWLSVEATPGPRVLCVADADGGAEDVARALNPRYRDAVTGGSIAVDVIATASLARTDVAAYDAVFLSNVAKLLPREQRLLQRYVAEGGALAVVLGDRSEPAGLNAWLRAEPPLSPVEMASQPAVGDWRLDPLNYRHAIVEPFAGRSRSGLLGVRVSKYWPLKVLDQDRAAVALEFTSDDPAIVIAEHGRGRVAILATNPALSTAGEPWSTLALSPAFVPLARELFTHLSADRRTSELNFLAGESVRELAASQSRRQGVYQVEDKSIAVNIDATESDLTTVSTSDLRNSESITQLDPGAGALDSGESIPLAGRLLVAAATLMLIELTAAWLLGRGWA